MLTKMKPGLGHSGIIATIRQATILTCSLAVRRGNPFQLHLHREQATARRRGQTMAAQRTVNLRHRATKVPMVAPDLGISRRLAIIRTMAPAPKINPHPAMTDQPVVPDPATNRLRATDPKKALAQLINRHQVTDQAVLAPATNHLRAMVPTVDLAPAIRRQITVNRPTGITARMAMDQIKGNNR
jgi:hypothetical protein